MCLSCIVTLLPLPSLVIWLAVDTAELPRTPVPLCGLFFSWLYNWKPTPMTHSKPLTPSVSECPSLLGLEFLLRERFGRCLEGKVEHLENRKLSHCHTLWPWCILWHTQYRTCIYQISALLSQQIISSFFLPYSI